MFGFDTTDCPIPYGEARGILEILVEPYKAYKAYKRTLQYPCMVQFHYRVRVSILVCLVCLVWFKLLTKVRELSGIKTKHNIQ
jgi:hypothetical protein